MNGPSGYWFIDGIDLGATFAIGILKGTALFLEMPERKESITHDWPDQHGVDMDTSKPLFKQRDIPLECLMLVDTKTEFLKIRNQFVTQMMKPGQRRLTIASMNGKSFFVVYKSMSSYEQAKRLTLSNGVVAHHFTLTVTELSPQIDYDDTYITADDGKFIIA